LTEIDWATGKKIAKHQIRLAKVIPGSGIGTSCAQLLIIINGDSNDPKMVEERRERRMVGKRLIVVLM
jgi:hypothetical protein